MLITHTFLKKHRACAEGLRWFQKTYPFGYRTESRLWSRDHYLSTPWLVELIILLADAPRFHREMHSRIPTSPLGKELLTYIHNTTSPYLSSDTLYSELSGLPFLRLVNCLTQVARVSPKLNRQ